MSNGNELAVGVMVLQMVELLVESPGDVLVRPVTTDRGVRLAISVADADRGKVIGKDGRIARALRTIVGAAAKQQGLCVEVDILKGDGDGDRTMPVD